ncbi:hypothetical protein PTKIN_Ptkin10aG0066800 [Pterospermum kingtungense]
MTEKVEIVLGEAIGEVEEIDTCGNGQMAWGKYLRARVLFNITKPLICGKMVTMGNNGGKLIKFQYERMHDFCYICALFDHQESECPTAITCMKACCKPKKEFRPWLRAKSAGFVSSMMYAKGPRPSYSQLRSTSVSSSSQLPQQTPQTKFLAWQDSLLVGAKIPLRPLDGLRNLTRSEEDLEEVNSSICNSFGLHADLNEKGARLTKIRIGDGRDAQLTSRDKQSNYARSWGAGSTLADMDNLLGLSNTRKRGHCSVEPVVNTFYEGMGQVDSKSVMDPIKGARLMDIPIRFDIGTCLPTAKHAKWRRRSVSKGG